MPASTDPTIIRSKILAVGADVNGTAPDFVALGTSGTVFIEYGNNVPSDGTGGGSTIIEYGRGGAILNSFNFAGSDDGLKIDPATGKLWVLQNQDGNSTLTIVDPANGQSTGPLSYAVPSSTQGYDDVAFTGGKVYLSHTNPAAPTDSVVVQLNNGNNPSGTLTTTAILRQGDTGTNLATGETNQPLPVSDPDSLKSLADGTLVLTGGDDAALTFIQHPGTDQQTASFIALPAGATGLDDAVIPSASSGTFVVADTAKNDIVKIAVSGLNVNDIYASVAGDNGIVQIDPMTGTVTQLATGITSPHGLAFIPAGHAGALSNSTAQHITLSPTHG